jgi:hypothetical protein
MTTHPVYKANPENLAELDEYREYVAHLAMPIYPLPGNHDIGYFEYKGSKYEKSCDLLIAAYKKKIGPLKRSFTQQGFRFILFNNNPPLSGRPGHIAEETFEWIEGELKQGGKAFLFCHVQVIENGTGPPWGDSAGRLVALCDEYGVVAVTYGHQHALHIKVLNGTKYIMCPDLKNAGHQGVLLYRVFRDRWELWLYDVFSQKGKRIGSYPVRSKDCDGAFRAAKHGCSSRRPWRCSADIGTRTGSALRNGGVFCATLAQEGQTTRTSRKVKKSAERQNERTISVASRLVIDSQSNRCRDREDPGPQNPGLASA